MQVGTWVYKRRPDTCESDYGRVISVVNDHLVRVWWYVDLTSEHVETDQLATATSMLDAQLKAFY